MSLLWLPRHCLSQMDPSFHVLTSRSSYTAWQSWRNPVKQIQMNKYHHLRFLLETLMNQKRHQLPLKVQKLLLWLEWWSSNRWQKSEEQSAQSDFSQHFNDRLLTLTVDFDEVIHLFWSLTHTKLIHWSKKTTEKTTARQRSHSIPDCRRHKYQHIPMDTSYLMKKRKPI